MKGIATAIITLIMLQGAYGQPGAGTTVGLSDAAALGSGGQLIAYEHSNKGWIKVASLKPFGIQALRVDELAIMWPWKAVEWEAGLIQQGDDGYKEQGFHLGAGRSLGQTMHLNVRCVAYYRRTPNNDRSRCIPYADLNLLYKPMTDLTLGFRLINPTGSRLNEEPRTILYQGLCLGLSYHLHPTVTYWLEGHKQQGQVSTLHTGFRYQPFKTLGFRCGLSAQPLQPSIGLEGSIKRLQYAVSWQIHAKLGATSAMTLTYLIP